MRDCTYLAHVDETLGDSYHEKLISRVFACIVGGERSEILRQLGVVGAGAD